MEITNTCLVLRFYQGSRKLEKIGIDEAPKPKAYLNKTLWKYVECKLIQSLKISPFNSILNKVRKNHDNLKI